jgi:hypothetical protein
MLNLHSFLTNGYIKLKFKNPKLIDKFKKKIKSKINTKLKTVKKKIVKLENFHKLNLNRSERESIFNSHYRSIKLDKSDIKQFLNNKYFQAIFEHYYGNKKPFILYPSNKKYKKNLSGFRVVAPSDKSGTGIHSESSSGIHCMTVWIPLTGLKSKSTLKIFPKSHMYRLENKHIVNHNKPNKARLIKNNFLKNFKSSKSLNFKKGEYIIFHPDLIHGNTKNKDVITRTSMELRIFSERKKRAIQENKSINLNGY